APPLRHRAAVRRARVPARAAGRAGGARPGAAPAPHARPHARPVGRDPGRDREDARRLRAGARQPARTHRTAPDAGAARALAPDRRRRTPWRTPRAQPARPPGGTRKRRRCLEMITALKHAWAAALLLAPLAASAQSPAPGPAGSPAPAAAALAPAAP